MSNNHMAVITTVTNVREHPGADRLKLATCVGNQIVVGLNTQDGDIGVYFNCDLQLSHDYAFANDLVRRKDEAGNNVGGMFDVNRRVRAQKLRGAISDGYFASLESLSLASGVSMQEINKLEDGTSFNEIGGIPICNKYVTESTKAARNTGTGPKPKESVSTVMFHKHIDTAHFGRNTHLLLSDPNGVLVIMTAKLHGCVERNTIVDTLEVGPITIGEVVDNKLDYKIKAFNTDTQEIVYVPIDNHYLVKDSGEWYEIELENGRKLTITGNNPVWLPDLNCYRRVDELVVDEHLLVEC